MKIVYLAGKYTEDTVWTRECNIRKAEAAALELWKLGYGVVSPHLLTRFFYGSIDEKQVMDFCLTMLRKSDIIILLPNFITSEGSLRELQEAMRYEKQIYFLVDGPTIVLHSLPSLQDKQYTICSCGSIVIDNLCYGCGAKVTVRKGKKEMLYVHSIIVDKLSIRKE